MCYFIFNPSCIIKLNNFYLEIMFLLQKCMVKWRYISVITVEDDCKYFSAVKQLIIINHIQNNSFCLHNICVHAVYIYYAYINKQTCMYILKKNMLCLNVKYIFI